ncbi:MAG: DUF1501 domain-containing protein [Pirellulales bacterium]|nr:DUF1501 domain-containing protein [Pirellulales bacterium]
MNGNQNQLSGGHLLDRRGFLGHMATGISGVALTQMLVRDGLLAETQRRAGVSSAPPIQPAIDTARPHLARQPHFLPRAKNIVVIFCSGATSQIDTFDYKPELIRQHGRPLPGGEDLVTFQGKQGKLTKSHWQFRPRGNCGKMISDLVPEIGSVADELCFIHSMTTKTNSHGPGENMMSTGFRFDGFPSLGGWLSYALGSFNDDLPAFVAIPDPRGGPQMAGNNWGSGFLPAAFQGTDFNTTKPIHNLAHPSGIDATTDAHWRAFLKNINQRHLQQFPEDTDLAARINSYELAARMQLSVPEVTDLSRESQHVLKLYGADDRQNKLKAAFARNCILARRLVERGVRVVQLFNGSYHQGGEGVSNWDAHKLIFEQYSKHGPVLDQPVAGLLKDLKQRGLLEDTLVVWTTEFGRMPTFQQGSIGRDHNPDGFTTWMAGAGVKAPFSFGATDELSYKAVEDVVTVHDFHATILHLLGLDHQRLSFYHNGIERRLTDVEGYVIEGILT